MPCSAVQRRRLIWTYPTGPAADCPPHPDRGHRAPGTDRTTRTDDALPQTRPNPPATLDPDWSRTYRFTGPTTGRRIGSGLERHEAPTVIEWHSE